MKKMIFLMFITCEILSVQIRPVPWLTQNAISFLDKFLADHPNARILEFGAGASTIWISKRTPNLFSVEHNPEWYKTVKKILESNDECNHVELYLKEKPYNDICSIFPDNYFDLILVDGRNRKACMRDSVRILKSGGIMMLDNAERTYYQSAIKSLFKNWSFNKTVQNKPDSCNFFYKNWQTNWWIKP